MQNTMRLKIIAGNFRLLRLLTIGILIVLSAEHTFSQTKTQMVRIAKIVVDPGQLENYKVALKEEIGVGPS